jgi:hypothetical protein
MKELLRGQSTISLEAAVLKCPNAELYRFSFYTQYTELYPGICLTTEEKARKRRNIKCIHVLKRETRRNGTALNT